MQNCSSADSAHTTAAAAAEGFDDDNVTSLRLYDLKRLQRRKCSKAANSIISSRRPSEI